MTPQFSPHIYDIWSLRQVDTRRPATRFASRGTLLNKARLESILHRDIITGLPNDHVIHSLANEKSADSMSNKVLGKPSVQHIIPYADR